MREVRAPAAVRRLPHFQRRRHAHEDVANFRRTDYEGILRTGVRRIEEVRGAHQRDGRPAVAAAPEDILASDPLQLMLKETEIGIPKENAVARGGGWDGDLARIRRRGAMIVDIRLDPFVGEVP